MTVEELTNETREEELAAHHAWIHSGDGLLVEKNVGSLQSYVSDSEFLWRLRARAAAPYDDARSIKDFPCLKLKEFWVHNESPISRMSLLEVTTTLWVWNGP
jgi:hypothetical protein